MFKVTEQAAKQILHAATESQCEGMGLRLAAKQNDDGSIEYGMGFDHATPDDEVYEKNGAEIIISPAYLPLLTGTTMDYVELEPGQFAFIFMNPNDANYQPGQTS